MTSYHLDTAASDPTTSYQYNGDGLERPQRASSLSTLANSAAFATTGVSCAVVLVLRRRGLGRKGGDLQRVNLVLPRVHRYDTPCPVSAAPRQPFVTPSTTTGKVVNYNGSTWASPLNHRQHPAADSISCISSTFCVAVDSGGKAVIDNGGLGDRPIRSTAPAI